MRCRVINDFIVQGCVFSKGKLLELSPEKAEPLLKAGKVKPHCQDMIPTMTPELGFPVDCDYLRYLCGWVCVKGWNYPYKPCPLVEASVLKDCNCDKNAKPVECEHYDHSGIIEVCLFGGNRNYCFDMRDKDKCPSRRTTRALQCLSQEDGCSA